MTTMPLAFQGHDFIIEFIDRASTGLRLLEDLLADPSADSLARFRRETHSLKGNADVYGLKDFALLCHRLEDALPSGAEWTLASQTSAGMYLAHLDVMTQRLKAEADV